MEEFKRKPVQGICPSTEMSADSIASEKNISLFEIQTLYFQNLHLKNIFETGKKFTKEARNQQ